MSNRSEEKRQELRKLEEGWRDRDKKRAIL